MRLRLVWSARTGTKKVPGDELRAIAEQATAGDVAATRTLLSALTPHMLRVVRRVLGPQHPELQDCLQEAALGFVRSLPAFEWHCGVTHFACRVAARTAMAVRRKLRADKRLGAEQLVDGVEPDCLPTFELDPERLLTNRRAAQFVRDLIAELPEPQAEALLMHVVLGYTVPEVAAICSIPCETVRSRVRVAKQVLRERLGLITEAQELRGAAE
jgi:RNA polymerase sigma-70 factor (ECF subfamily)